MDELEGVTGREEAPAPEVDAGDGFQLVAYGKKKKKKAAGQEGGGSTSGSDATPSSGSARALTKDKAAALGAKAKVSFHDPSIPRPQEVYKIIVDNYNPFKHVWLEHSEDGTRPVHPLEKLPVEQFIDRNVSESEPVKPTDLQDTPFTLVDDLQGLRELSKKLKSVTEFAVDLEHNQYRSFQGLTCLMQISTRTEDFIVDTLKLRIYIGLYLQDHFKDPTKRKALHNWRDAMARREDESTGYILPNKALLEIAKQMPTDAGHLKRIVKSKYPFVESHLNDIVYTIREALKCSHLYEGIPEQLKKERLEQLALRNVKASDETTRLDADIDRSNIYPADQSSMAPPSTASANVASGSGTGILNEAALFSGLYLEDKTSTISPSETKTSQFLPGLNRPMNNDFLSNNRYQQVGSNVEKYNTSALPFQRFSGPNIVPEESLYPVPGMYSDDFWIQSSQMGEVMQLGDTTYYPQFAGYSSEVDSHYESESMQMSGYLSSFDPSFESINQRGTGTGQPPGNIKEASFQNPMRRQSFPPSNNRYDSTYR